MSRVVVVTSGKGGVGKTTLVANLGTVLAQNHKVCLIDADLGLKNLDVIIGVENRVVYDIEDVIEGRAELSQALVKDKKQANLSILPACRNIDVQQVDFNYLTKMVKELEKDNDFILIDSPAGIERGFLNAINPANEAIVVITLDLSSIRDADKVIGLLNKQGINEIKVVVNRYNPDLLETDSLTIEDALEILNLPLLGIIYFDENMSNMNNKGELVFYSDKSQSRLCYLNIAKRLQGEKIPLAKYKKKSIFARIFG